MSSLSDNGRYRRNVVIFNETAQARRVQSDIVALVQACDFSEPEVLAVRLAVEEALVNAIKHGNGLDPTKKISVEYEISPESVRIRIEDEGPGFDPAAVPDPTSAEFLERPNGRGLMLMRYYMSQVEFLGRGNCVEMWKRRKKGESC